MAEREQTNVKWIIVAVTIIGGLSAWWSLAPSSGPRTVAVAVPQTLSTAATKGLEAFRQTCAACHGDSAGGTDKGPPLIHVIYRPGHHADGAIRKAVAFGVRQHHWPFGDMPAQPHVTGADVDAIIAFLRETQRANGIQ